MDKTERLDMDMFSKLENELSNRRRVLTEHFESMRIGDERISRQLSDIAQLLGERKTVVSSTKRRQKTVQQLQSLHSNEDIKPAKSNSSSGIVYNDDDQSTHGYNQRTEMVEDHIKPADRDINDSINAIVTAQSDTHQHKLNVEATALRESNWHSRTTGQARCVERPYIKCSSDYASLTDPRREASGTEPGYSGAKAQEVTVNHHHEASSNLSRYGGTKAQEVTANDPSYHNDILQTLLRQDLKVVKNKPSYGIDSDVTAMVTNMMEDINHTTGSHTWHEAYRAVKDMTTPMSSKGADTILCLDTSKPASADKVRDLAIAFINGIEAVCRSSGVDENICVISSGRAEIVHQLSNDYNSLRTSIETMAFGGSATGVEALLKCVAALTQCGSCYFDGGFRIPPRIILLTDGFGSSFPKVNKKSTFTRWIFTYLKTIGYCCVNPRIEIPIFVSPLDSKQKDMLHTATEECATVVDDIQFLCDHQTLQIFCAKVVKHLANDYDRWSDRADCAPNFVESLTFGMNQYKKNLVFEEVMKHFTCDNNVAAATDVMDNVSQSPSIPLGTRVVPGPDMKGEEDSHNWKGTVVNQGKYPGTVWVLWDHGDCRYCCYGYSNLYDVLISENQSRDPEPDGSLAIGMQVERGPDWQQGERFSIQRTGLYGIVIRIWKGRIVTIWKNQYQINQNFGDGGLYHVKIRDTPCPSTNLWATHRY